MPAETIIGLDSLAQGIAAVNSQLRAALPAIVMSGAQIVEGEIRRRAPVRTGALVRHLDSKLANAGANSASAVVQIEESADGKAEQYAISQEFGTSKRPAKPFFRPGAAAAASQAQSLLAASITSIINK
jgi:HK97 gp10 family phage protein